MGSQRTSSGCRTTEMHCSHHTPHPHVLYLCVCVRVCVCVCVCGGVKHGAFDPIVLPKYSNLSVISNLLVVVSNLSLFINCLFAVAKHAFSPGTHLHGGTPHSIEL